MPFGIACEPRLQLGQLPIGIDRGSGRGVDRHDRIDEIGVGDRPLERLVADPAGLHVPAQCALYTGIKRAPALARAGASQAGHPPTTL